MSDDPTEQNAVILRLLSQDEAVKDKVQLGALRELLRAGISVQKAAEHLGLERTVAWRMVTSDKAAQKALNDGDDFRRRQLRATLESRADEMLAVIVSLAHDPEADGKVRLAAAQDILDRTGLLDKNVGGGNKSGGKVGAVIELTSVEKGFNERLHRITARVGAESSE
jgi:hypothetical protein